MGAGYHFGTLLKSASVSMDNILFLILFHTIQKKSKNLPRLNLPLKMCLTSQALLTLSLGMLAIHGLYKEKKNT